MSDFKKAILLIEEALAHQNSKFAGEASAEMALTEDNETNINNQNFQEIQQQVSALKFNYFELNQDIIEQLKVTIKNNSEQKTLVKKLNKIIVKKECDDDKNQNCEAKNVILSLESFIDLLK